MIRRHYYGLIYTAALVVLTNFVGCKPQTTSQHNSDEQDITVTVSDSINEVPILESSQLKELESSQITDSQKFRKTEIELVDSVDLVDSSFLELSMLVTNLLSERDLAKLNEYIHPELGLIFSPYAFIDSPQVWTFFEPNVETTTELYHWGYYDGSGDSIIMTFDDYYKSFVYCADFLTKLDTTVNHSAHAGNSLNNFNTIFPNASYVDFHVEGTEQYGYLDWRLLRLGFELKDGRWYLLAVIHDEWTI
jgi:hypothetical protein